MRSRPRFIVLGIVLACLSLPLFANAASLPVPGRATDVVLDGDLAFVASREGGLQVVDVSDPDAPFVAGSATTTREAWCIAVDGDLAYLGVQSDGGSAIDVFDIADPLHPTLLTSHPTAWWAYRLDIEGDVLYVADRFQGLTSIDISDPTSLTTIHNMGLPGDVHAVDVEGTIAYVSTSQDGVKIVDVYDPASPYLMASVPGNYHDVALHGNLLYAADFTGMLTVIDVSSPGSPTVELTEPVNGDCRHVSIDGDYLYLSASAAGTIVYDITEPLAPTAAAVLPVDTAIWSSATDGELVVAADRPYGVHVSRVKTLLDPLEHVASSIALTGTLVDVEIAGDMACVLTSSWFYVVDITDPAQPVVIGDWGPVAGTDLAICGQRVYVVTDNPAAPGLYYIFNLFNPASPYYLDGWLARSGRVVKVAGDLMYVGAVGGGVDVYSLRASPEIPPRVGVLSTPEATALDVHGNTLLVANDQSDLALEAWDITDPAAATLLGACPDTRQVRDMVVTGDRAYLAASDDDAPVRVVDISDPTDLHVIAGADWLNPRCLARSGDHVFVTTAEHIGFIDVTDPTAPLWYSGILCSHTVTDLTASGAYLFAATENRLQIVRAYDGPTAAYDVSLVWYNPDPVSVCNYPNGLGMNLIALGAKIDVYVSDDGEPVADLAAEDIWIETANPNVAICIDGAIAERPTDQDGYTEIVGPFAAGGWCAVGDLHVVVDGQPQLQSPLSMSWNSPDINADLVVNLSDVVLFAGDYYSYHQRSDFNGDGSINLSDITWFTGGLGSECPPGAAARRVPATVGEVRLRMADQDPAGTTTAHIVASGLTAAADLVGWELALALPPGAQLVSVDLAGSGMNVLEAPRFMVGLAGPARVEPDGSVRLATVRWRAAPGAGSATLTGLDGGSPVCAVGRDGAQGRLESAPIIVDGAAPGETLPRALAVSAAPNPCNPRTTIRYALPASGFARIAVYGLDGRLVRTLVAESRPAGRHAVDWMGRDDAGRSVASGAYVARVEWNGETITQRLTLLK